MRVLSATVTGVSDGVQGSLGKASSLGSKTMKNLSKAGRFVSSGDIFGEYTPACGVEKEEWFAEKTVKGIVYKDVLNLEATMIPNGWGPRVGWKFYPKSDFLNVWDSVLAVMVIWVAIMEPIRVGFSIETGYHDALYWFELVVDILFMLDLIVCLRTCFFVRDEWENLYLVQDLGQIRSAYFRSWFLLDLIAVFPVAHILEIYEAAAPGDNISAEDKNVLKFILRLVRLTKLIRLRRISDLMARMEHTFPKLFESYVLIKMFFSITYCAHLIACLWYLCGVAGGDSGWIAGVEETADTDSVTRMYLMSFYWSFTTMTTVGFGDITGATGLEQAFSIIAMGIGGFTFALIVGSIGDMITKAGVAETAYVQMMGELKEFLNSKSVPNDLAVRVITFHERLYANRTVFDEGKIMGRLPSAIRSDLVMHMFGSVLRRVPLFQDLNDTVLADVCLELKAYHAAQGEAFTVEGEPADEMFIIRSGMIRLTVQGHELRSSPMKGGDFFGVICLAGLSDIRPYTTTALRQCQLCTLSRADMQKLVALHPEMADVIMAFAKRRLNEINSDVKEVKQSIKLKGEPSSSDLREGTDLACEINSMRDMNEGEFDVSSMQAEVAANKKRASELFRRIHLARYVATSTSKEKWKRGLSKLKKGGRFAALIAESGNSGKSKPKVDSEGGDAHDGASSADEAEKDKRVEKTLDDLLAVGVDKNLDEVQRSLESGLGINESQESGAGVLRGVSEKVAQSNPVLGAIAALSAQIAEQQRDLVSIRRAVDELNDAQEVSMSGNITRYR